MEIRVDVKGISCHGSAPERGVNAAYKAAKAALAIEQLNKDLKPDAENFLGKGTICVSQMDVKGPSQCAVADYAMIYCDRRLTWGENADMAIKQVKEYVSKGPPGIRRTRSSSRCPTTKGGLDEDPVLPGVVLPHLEDRPQPPARRSGGEGLRDVVLSEPVVDKWDVPPPTWWRPPAGTIFLPSLRPWR
jgi:acetylornithine deacetylase/succinyl-diaminopimelate desuccinylase-like protein